MHHQEGGAPDISGPSELGLSLELRVSPDVLNMDGVSQSTLTITSRDSNGNILPNVDVRVEAIAGGEIVDVFGRLSTKNVKTGGDGRASVTYTAPNTAQNTTATRQDGVTLSPPRPATTTTTPCPAGGHPPGAAGRPAAAAFAPVARFTLSPTAPGEDQDVIFDGSLRRLVHRRIPTDPNDVSKCTPTSGAITSYQWDFGNGQTAAARGHDPVPTRGPTPSSWWSPTTAA